MSVCYIIGAAPFDAETFLFPREDDYVICADGGYEHLNALGIVPDVIIGDFDSGEDKGEFPCEVIRLRPEKDDTDTISAVKVALARGWKVFCLYGVLGGRLDHTFANIQLLSFLLENGAAGTLYNRENTVTLLENNKLVLPKNDEMYLSVFSFSVCCKGVTLRGVKYPLEDAVLTSAFPLGVSNEIVSDYAEVSVTEGKLLVMLSSKVSQ